jgi:hypothetical protein
MQRFASLGIAVLVWGFPGGAGVAQDEGARAWFNIYPLVSGGNVTVSIEGVNAGIQGWAFGLCHDPNAASVSEVQVPQELQTIRHGNPPDFLVCEEAVDGYGRKAGVVQAVVLAYQEFLLLPSRPGGFPVLDVKYDITSESSVYICNGLRGGGQPVAAVLTSRGKSLPLTKQPTATLSSTASSAWYTLSPAVSDSNVTVSIESNNAEIQGWSFGLAHDPAAVRVATYEWTPELATANNGKAPSFYSSELATEGPTGAGIVQAVILNSKAPVVLPARAGGFPVLNVQYDVMSESTVSICDGLRGSGQPVQSIFTVDASTYAPAAPASASLVRKPYASKLAYRAEPPESGQVITVKLYAEDLSVEGWSFALCHTAQAAEVMEVATSPQVMTLLGGEAPEFVLNDIVQAGPFVAVTQKVVLGTYLEPVSRGPFPDGLPVLGIRYDVIQNDSLKFCDGDPSGDIAFEGGVLVDGVSYVPSTRLGASLVLGAMGTQFIRGDADLNRRVNLTDAVYILMALFMGGPQLACLDAADANDVARVDISDPIFILNFLFLGGPRPPEPFPEPGEDLNPTSALGCTRGL